jgi:hypothetical protein
MTTPQSTRNTPKGKKDKKQSTQATRRLELFGLVTPTAGLERSDSWLWNYKSDSEAATPIL